MRDVAPGLSSKLSKLALTVLLVGCAEAPRESASSSRRQRSDVESAPAPEAVASSAASATPSPASSDDPIPGAELSTNSDSSLRVVGPHAVLAMVDGAPIVVASNPRALKGKPVLNLVSGGGSFVTDDVDFSRLPAETLRLVGTRWMAVAHARYGIEASCVGTITGFMAYTPAWGTADYDGLVAHYNTVAPEDRATDPKVSAEAWRVLKNVGGFRWIVAKVAWESRCAEQTLWAAPAGTPVPEIAFFREMSPRLFAPAQGAFRALPIYGAVERAYARQRKPSDPAQWWERPAYVESYLTAKMSDGREMAYVAGTSCGGYAEFTMNLETFFWLSPMDTFVAIPGAKPSEARSPEALGDIDHNGELDIVAVDGFMLSKGGKFEEQVHTRGPITPCSGDGAAAAAFNGP